METIKTGIYEHYKHKRYEVIDVALHSETEEPVVVYKALYKSEYPEGTLWVRPLAMFQENVTVDGQSVPRFKFVGPATHQFHHHYRSPYKRALFCFILIAFTILIGTIGIHILENMPYLDAFYFISMIATAQGPITIPQTAAGKIFAVAMSFISVGTVVAALGFLFGPFFGKLWHVGVVRLEKDMHIIPRKDKHI